MAHAGRRPARPTALLKENGEMTKSPDEAVLRWHEYFNKILNIPSQYCQDVVDVMPATQIIGNWMILLCVKSCG